jgi:hypothetical protein
MFYYCPYSLLLVLLRPTRKLVVTITVGRDPVHQIRDIANHPTKMGAVPRALP